MSKPRAMVVIIVGVAGLTALAFAITEILRALIPDTPRRTAVEFALLGGLGALVWARGQFRSRPNEDPDPLEGSRVAIWDRYNG